MINLVSQMQRSKKRGGNCKSSRAIALCVLGAAALSLTACITPDKSHAFLSSFQSMQPHAVPNIERSASVSPHIQLVSSRTTLSVESLLEAEGNWNMVEQNRSYDPAKAHLQARKNVNIHRRKNMAAELSAHFKPDAKSGEDGKTRILRLEQGKSGENHDLSVGYGATETAFTKPTQVIAGPGLMKKIKKMFGPQATYRPAPHAVRPSRKPVKTAPPLPDQNGTILNAKEDERQNDAVIAPPAMPDRKLLAEDEREAQSVRSAEVLENPVLANVVVPGRKPVSAKNVKRQTKVHIKGQAGGHVQATKIRSGRYKGKNRLVIEVTNTAKYKVAVDHIRQVLRLKLYKTEWSLGRFGKTRGGGAFGSYVAREQDDGTVLVEVRLEQPLRIADTMMLRPNASSQHRIVVDLIP